MEFILEEETNSSEFYSEDQTEQNMKFLYSCSYSYDYKVRLHSKKAYVNQLELNSIEDCLNKILHISCHSISPNNMS